jgi:hypothetical protein
MTIIIDENPYVLNHTGTGPAYIIRVKGIREQFEADNDKQLLLAIEHHFRPRTTDPSHWLKGHPDCPLCP